MGIVSEYVNNMLAKQVDDHDLVVWYGHAVGTTAIAT